MGIILGLWRKADIIMKPTIQIILSLFIIVACNAPINNKRQPASSRAVQIKLVDSLGQISLSVPARYDPFFSWINWSDCGKACAHQEYRYQPKMLAISQESGFIYLGDPIDSVDQFTVIHPSYLFRNKDRLGVDSLRYKDLRINILNDPSYPPIVYDTLERIGDRYFSIYVLQRSETIHDIRVLAVTNIKGNEIVFRYDLLSKKEDS